MLPFDFYIASLKHFIPGFGWSEFLRLRRFSHLSLNELGRRLDLPEGWIKQSENWYEYQSEVSKVIWPFSDLYPPCLMAIQRPPLFLFLKQNKQNFNDENLHALSVVGSREIYPQVMKWMDIEFSDFLKNSSVKVLSGGARGVDQKAHFLALRHGRPTWVFFPSGLDQLYPSQWKAWEKEFLQAGAVFVSEYERGVGMRKHHFLRRNELIVAYSDSCFVAQAARRSGSSITAGLAQSMGVSLGTLPFFPDDRKAQACLDLIADGALMIRDAKDLQVWIQSALLSSRSHEKSETDKAEHNINAPNAEPDGKSSAFGDALKANVNEPICDNNGN